MHVKEEINGKSSAIERLAERRIRGVFPLQYRLKAKRDEQGRHLFNISLDTVHFVKQLCELGEYFNLYSRIRMMLLFT